MTGRGNIVLLALAVLALLGVALFAGCDRKDQSTVTKEPSSEDRIAVHPDAPVAVRDLIAEFKKVGPAGPTGKQQEDVGDLALQSLKDAVKKLDEAIQQLAAAPGDSPEFETWKLNTVACLKEERDKLAAISSSERFNVHEAEKLNEVALMALNECRKASVDAAKQLNDPKEREKADKND